jgi:nickel-dependent lactate racemase
VIELPWAAWFADELHRLSAPEGWTIDRLGPRGAAGLDKTGIRSSLHSPIDSPRLIELARGRRSACIVVDDLARPTRAFEVLPSILGDLREAGLSEESIRVVVATGSHGALTRQQLEWKLGSEITKRLSVECHDCRGELAATGIPYGDRELRINRTFMNSELGSRLAR